MSSTDHPTPSHDTAAANGRATGSAAEVFGAFLRLGLSSFGGPVAHIGYFREELVVRRGWVSEEAFADLVALCQFLPGPASSQVGFCLGMLRCGRLGAGKTGARGLLGGVAAFVGFTLPSALVMTLCALGLSALHGPELHGPLDGVLHGLKLVAVAVVGQALYGMARSLTPDRTRAAIAMAALMGLVFVGGALVQLAAIALGALAGLAFCRQALSVASGDLPCPIPRRLGAGLLALFAVILLGGPLLAQATDSAGLKLFDAFYRSGALVFGGGHVVLPLLQTAVVAPGWVSPHSFLAGYGLAQAMPGPLFTFAAFLGAGSSMGPGGWAGAALALAAIFLPGLLLVSGMLPFWHGLRERPKAQAAMRGANAAVVGVLAAAFYDPIWRSAVLAPKDFALALAGFVALVAWRAPPWVVVVTLALAGWITGG